MEPQVTVIITTRDRPGMLAEALESVRRQTGLARVARVLVSENGETGDSKVVCERFQDLPLLYVRQQPPVSSLLHLSALWHNVESSLVAILHDDDWWLPDHLKNSVAVLDAQPDCVVTFSNFVDTLGPKIVPFASDKAWRVWAATGGDFSAEVLMMDKVSVLLACLLHSAFHYSTMVGRKDAIWESDLKKVAADNAWDNERTVPVFLSASGLIGYLTRPAAMIRRHPSQEGQDLSVAGTGFDATRVKTTQWLAQADPENAARAAQRFNDTISRVDPGVHALVLGLISSQIDEPQKTFLIEQLGFGLMPGVRKDAKWLLGQFTPPALPIVQRKITRLFKR